MKQVPITRFRREIRKWVRKKESIEITKNGKVVMVFLPVDAYNSLLNLLKNNC